VEHCHATVKVQTQIQIETESHVVVQDKEQCDQAAITADIAEVEVDALVADVVDDAAADCDNGERVLSLECVGCDLPPSMPAKEENTDVNYGASLRALFELPADYDGRGEEDSDEDLVTRYAEDLQDSACIDAAVAYGIALDTFLADPAEFRYQIGGVKSRMPQRSPYRTPEQYDLYYEEEDYSPAKSTTKKPIMSNSHTYFTSPAISSPIRMSILSEDAEIEVECVDTQVEVDAAIIEVALHPETLPMTQEEDVIVEGSEDIFVEKEKDTVPMVVEENIIQAPTTPSAKSFASAYGVLSAKKSARKSSIRKVEKTPFSALSTPLIVDVGVVHVESTGIMVDDPATSEEAVSQVAESIAAEMLPETESNEVSSEGDTVACSSNDAQLASTAVVNSLVISPSPTPLPIVEPWIASAAATLQKSLPPKSAQKSGRKLQRPPTPRQSSKKECKPDMDVETDQLEPQQSLTLQLDELLDEEMVEMNDEEEAVEIETISVETPELEVEGVVEIETLSIETPSIELGINAEPTATVPVVVGSTPSRSTRSRAATPLVINTAVDIEQSPSTKALEISSEEVIFADVAIDENVETVVSAVDIQHVEEAVTTTVEEIIVATRSTRSKAATPVAKRASIETAVVNAETTEEAEVAQIGTEVAHYATEDIVCVATQDKIELIVSDVDIQPVEEAATTPVEEVIVATRSTRSKAATPVAKIVPIKSPKNIKPATPTVAITQPSDMIEVVKAVDDVAIVEALAVDASTECASEDSLDDVTVPKGRGKRVQEVKKVEEVMMKRSRRGAPIDESSLTVEPAVDAVLAVPDIVDAVIEVAPTPKGRSTRGRQQVVEEEVATPVPVQEEVVEAVIEVAPTPKGRSTRGRQQVVEEEAATPAPVQEEVVEAVIEVAPTPKGRSTRGRQQVVEEAATPAPVQEKIVEAVIEVAPTPTGRSTRGRQQVVEEEVATAAPVQDEVVEAVVEVAPTPKGRSTRGRQQVVEEEKPAAEKQDLLEGSARLSRKRCIDTLPVAVKVDRRF
jgi:hypothetical protein